MLAAQTGDRPIQKTWVGRIAQTTATHFDFQTQRIYERNRVAAHVGICIDPAPQPDRIAFEVPSDLRIVIAMVVVERVTSTEDDLTRQPPVVQVRNGARRRLSP